MTLQNTDNNINIYIKRLSGDILHVEYDSKNNKSLHKHVLNVLEDIKDEYTTHHPFIINYKSIFYHDRSPEKDIFYFPPSISDFNHPYVLFPLNVNKFGSITEGDVYGIVTYENLNLNIKFSSSFSSYKKYTYVDQDKNTTFFCHIYTIYFTLEKILQSNPYNLPEITKVCYNIEIPLLRPQDSYKYKKDNPIIFVYSEVTFEDNNTHFISSNNESKKKTNLFDAFYNSKELSDFNLKTRSSIVEELIKFYNWI
jgi:hypothetical protein